MQRPQRPCIYSRAAESDSIAPFIVKKVQIVHGVAGKGKGGDRARTCVAFVTFDASRKRRAAAYNTGAQARTAGPRISSSENSEMRRMKEGDQEPMGAAAEGEAAGGARRFVAAALRLGGSVVRGCRLRVAPAASPTRYRQKWAGGAQGGGGGRQGP